MFLQVAWVGAICNRPPARGPALVVDHDCASLIHIPLRHLGSNTKCGYRTNRCAAVRPTVVEEGYLRSGSTPKRAIANRPYSWQAAAKNLWYTLAT